MKIIVGFVFWLMKILILMLMVAFYTLLERKVMSSISRRKGPKKVSIIGLLQPIFDSLKLVMKDFGVLFFSQYLLYVMCPMGALFILIQVWLLCMYKFSFFLKGLGLLIFVCLTSFNVYILMFSGWSSNSKYSLMGSFRGVAQIMSYEVCLFLMIFFPSYLEGSFNKYKIFNSLKNNFFFFFSMFIMWLIVCLAEVNRPPFDFAEGESELVSGFKIEYGSLLFAFLYLGEYGSMVVMGFMSGILFFNKFMLVLVWMGMMFFFMWIRKTLPRFRYDFLMKVGWFSMLPLLLLNVFLLMII